jgi:hypothetical protein
MILRWNYPFLITYRLSLNLNYRQSFYSKFDEHYTDHDVHEQVDFKNG